MFDDDLHDKSLFRWTNSGLIHRKSFSMILLHKFNVTVQKQQQQQQQRRLILYQFHQRLVDIYVDLLYFVL